MLLDAINDPETESADHLVLLKDFLNDSRPREEIENEVTYLPDIMETWSLAAQMGNDNLLSAVPVALALLLKIISSILELKPSALGIGRTLLYKRQQELIARNLSADKGKEFIISPTLRLLREVVCLDGGVLAQPVFRARTSTFKSLARNMGIKFLGEGFEDIKRPSGRTNAVRFFLSSLRFLHTEAKAELLSQRDIVASLTKTIREDPPYLITEILDALRSSVLGDRKLPRYTKSRTFNANTLTRLSGLYGYEHDKSATDSDKPVDEVVHEFLELVCTSPKAGVLRQSAGFYPKDVDPDEVATEELPEDDELTLDRVVWMNKFAEEVPVHNETLSEFLQTLRPWSSTKQGELLVAIFNAAPELVADYFIRKKTFSFEPKLSATWIGYASLIFSTIQVGIPPYFGHASQYAHVPPPTSVLVDNILPLPLTQKALSRCLSAKPKLISFFALRLLVVALAKLQRALKYHAEASRINARLWDESARRLVDEFCQRCPNMRDVINAYRGADEDDLLQREAASRALRLYYEVVPQVALLAKFDVSPLLVGVLKQVRAEGRPPRDRALSIVELENLLVIASSSPGMRWFSKTEGLPLSPFVTLLQVLVDAGDDVSLGSLHKVLDFVAQEQQLVLPRTAQSPLAPLLMALKATTATGTPITIEAVWAFLDNSAVRCASTPVKYLEMMQDLAEEAVTQQGGAPHKLPISLLVVTLLEQLPFMTASADVPTLDILARFFAQYAGACHSAGEDRALIQSVLAKARGAFAAESTMAGHLVMPKSLAIEQGEVYAVLPETVLRGQALQSTEQESLTAVLDVDLPLEGDHSSLTRWATKTVDELMDEGHATGLVMLLTSEHTSIRKEAVINLLKMAARVRESSYDEKDQVWLLLSELVESSKGRVGDGPLPSHTAAFACHALEVVKNPLHPLYAKVNTFLTAGPVWDPDKVALVYDILQAAPSQDDSYYASISWLMGYLLDSLRTAADLTLFHNKRLFEKILSLAGNSYLRRPLRTQVLRVVYRASHIEGGSTTLITRFGVMGWLEGQAALCESREEARMYKGMLARLWETCDQERIAAWSKQGIQELVQR